MADNATVTQPAQTTATPDPSDGMIVIPPREKDLGGFSVRRLLPYAGRRMVGPWIFFDHMGPADFPAGQGIDVRPHPHINLATVTYLFEGEILHRDSLGSEQPIRPGDINLMIAGRGIVHSERERPETREQSHRVHGLQLWMALPEAEEECEPAFIHTAAADIPQLEVGEVPVRVMIGEAYGVTSPVRQIAGALYMEARLQAGQQLLLPEAEERAVYVVEGQVSIGEVTAGTGAMVVLSSENSLQLQAEEQTQIALIGGELLGERHIFWNFVSSRPERIEQAKADWKSGQFPKVPGDEEEYIPLPE